jgi:3-carboxy-cis,cis-muconate cycloisomerase
MQSLLRELNMNLYQNIFYSSSVNELFSDESTVAYLLQFEAALALAQAQNGFIPTTAASVIDQCCKTKNIDIQQLIADAGLGGNVNIPLIKQLTAVVKKTDNEASKFVHFGATSQDVIDTATMLQARDALKIIQSNLQILINQLTILERAHQSTTMIGRSFMQHARPITFGFKVSTWLGGLLRSWHRIDTLLKQNFVLQLGGAVGNLSSMQAKGAAIAETMAQILGLNNPEMSWHTQRDRFAEIATTLGLLTGNISKIAKDISLLMQTEIAEVFEPSDVAKGGSSTMPHKRNPVSSIAILANAQRVPHLVATMLSCMTHDHERATGAWHAEWETLAEIIKLTAGTVQQAVTMTNGLEVDKAQMLKNIEATNGLIFAENLSLALAEKIGKTEAHHVVEQLCKESIKTYKHLKIIALQNETIQQHFNEIQINKMF